jgi:hypothetical protein
MTFRRNLFFMNLPLARPLQVATLGIALTTCAGLGAAKAQVASDTTSNLYDSLYGSSSSTTSATLSALESQPYGSTCDPTLATVANEVAAQNEQRRQILITSTIQPPSPMSCISSALANFNSIAGLFSLGGIGNALGSLATQIANGLVNEACVAVNQAAGEITGNFYGQILEIEQTPYDSLAGLGGSLASAEGSTISSVTMPAVSAATSTTGAAAASVSTSGSSVWSGFFQ